MTTTLYANPYDISYTGFYFDNADQFTEQLSQAKFEEVEIDYIDGDNPRLFNAAGISQCNIDIWFDDLDHLTDGSDEALAIEYQLEFMDLISAIEQQAEVNLYRGSIVDYAAELIEEIYPINQLPDIIKNHIDYAGIANDMKLNSEVAEIDHNLWVVNCLNF